MRRFAVVMLIFTFCGCAHHASIQTASQRNAKAYSDVAVTLSDFSMKIVAYYQSQNLTVPSDFDANQFFTLLTKIYPDQIRAHSVQDSYRVSVRPLDGGYSVMLCDPKSDRKVMEDLSCHLDRVEIRSWESNTPIPCSFESHWESQCK